MLIAIDYDKTWTADPDLFGSFAKSLKKAGHKCICVTSRATDTENNDLANSIGQYMPIVYAGNQPKRKAAEKQRYHVNIWIDDMPESITRQDENRFAIC